jgi:hypothetical protein
MHVPMSGRLVRLANTFTLGAWMASIACTSSDPPDTGRPASAEDDAASPEKIDANPDPVDTDPDSDPDPTAAESIAMADSPESDGGEVEEPEPTAIIPAAPADYGVFKFVKPPPTEEELVLYGLAGYEIVAVYAEPNKDSAHLGFLRIGARMRVGKKIETDDCRKGWHPLEGGGYACASRGLVVDTRDPFMSYKPAPARLDQPFPYDWAYVREWNTPMWWQVPSAAALAATREKRAILEAERTGQPLPGSEPASTGTTGASEGGEPAGDGAEGGEAAPPPPPPPPPEPKPAEEKPPVQIPLSPSTPWLEKGFFLSVGETIREENQSYWRTARGGIVEKSRAHPYEAKDFKGAELFVGMDFPFGFVMAKDGTKLLKLGSDDKLHATGKTLDKRAFLDLGEEVEIAGRPYFTVIPYPPEPADDEPNAEPADPQELLLVKADVMRLADQQPVPKGLDPWDRWIDVDITKQILVAYEGTRPVYSTLVSTGKKGSPEEPFDTPVGRYRIYSKQVTSNMDGATATDGNYAIQDVPWVMYFQGSYALHGAFWHTSFGAVRSHGCVNLGPSDARWLFFWTTPFLPERWHGVTAGDDNPGTTVIVRKS